MESLKYLGMGMGSECCPCRASGSAGGGAEEKQGGDGADNGGETQAEKRRSVFEAGCDCAD